MLFLSAKRGTLPFSYDSLFYSCRFATIRYINTEILLHVKCSYNQCQVIQNVINVNRELNKTRGLNFADLKRPNHIILTWQIIKVCLKPKDQKFVKFFLGFSVNGFKSFCFCPISLIRF